MRTETRRDALLASLCGPKRAKGMPTEARCSLLLRATMFAQGHAVYREGMQLRST
jgi:hypothetical protein